MYWNLRKEPNVSDVIEQSFESRVQAKWSLPSFSHGLLSSQVPSSSNQRTLVYWSLSAGLIRVCSVTPELYEVARTVRIFWNLEED